MKMQFRNKQLKNASPETNWSDQMCSETLGPGYTDEKDCSGEESSGTHIHKHIVRNTLFKKIEQSG